MEEVSGASTLGVKKLHKILLINALRTVEESTASLKIAQLKIEEVDFASLMVEGAGVGILDAPTALMALIIFARGMESAVIILTVTMEL
mmetsp:Transcript_20746/g.40737  ORF Transcript_20746/g.40737 Transcript_20746/m.40737 type:complete len:89 (+) Transcript_20746:139-405(+)